LTISNTVTETLPIPEKGDFKPFPDAFKKKLTKQNQNDTIFLAECKCDSGVVGNARPCQGLYIYF